MSRCSWTGDEDGVLRKAREARNVKQRRYLLRVCQEGPIKGGHLWIFRLGINNAVALDRRSRMIARSQYYCISILRYTCQLLNNFKASSSPSASSSSPFRPSSSSSSSRTLFPPSRLPKNSPLAASVHVPRSSSAAKFCSFSCTVYRTLRPLEALVSTLLFLTRDWCSFSDVGGRTVRLLVAMALDEREEISSRSMDW